MDNIIQIAGIIDLQEAKMLLEKDVDLLGFPLRLPVNKEDLSKKEAAAIIQKINMPEKFVLITYLNIADEIIKLCTFLGLRIVQIHSDIGRKELKKLKKTEAKFQIIKSLVIGQKDESALSKIIHETYDCVDYYITDTYDPMTGASGATGKTHDWSISRQLVEISPKPVILAGGLNPENVRNAIHQVKPAGVDAHTGVEDSNGRKDSQKVQRFVEEARKGFSDISNSSFMKFEIDGTLDLHTFHPSEVKDLIPEYIDACIKKDIFLIRIIHGKGKGILKQTVHSILRKSPKVNSFEMADEHGGNWGATVISLIQHS